MWSISFVSSKFLDAESIVLQMLQEIPGTSYITFPGSFDHLVCKIDVFSFLESSATATWCAVNPLHTRDVLTPLWWATSGAPAQGGRQCMPQIPLLFLNPPMQSSSLLSLPPWSTSWTPSQMMWLYVPWSCDGILMSAFSTFSKSRSSLSGSFIQPLNSLENR